MNTKRTEGMGVTTVNQFLFASEILMPHIDFNDRTESWDGHIFVYESEDNRKSNLFGRIPLQVKTSKVKAFSEQDKSLKMDVSDIKNYKNDGGVIIFSVECCGTDRKLYYVSLLPYDLSKLLENLKPKQKTKNIKLIHIAESEILKFDLICREFLIHKKKQFSLLNYDFPYDKVNEFLMEGVMQKDDTLEYILLSQAHYIYGKVSPDSESYEFVTKASIGKLEKRVDKPILIGDKEYYSGYRVVQTKDAADIILGNYIKLTFSENTYKADAKFQGNLLERIHDTNFFLDFLKRKAMNISGKGRIFISDFDVDIEEKIRRYNENLKNILALLNIFRVNPENIDLDTLSEEDMKILNILITSMVLNREINSEIFKNVPGKYNFKIGNMNILTHVTKSESSKIVIENISDVRIAIKDDQEFVHVSPYVMLNSEDIVCSTNVVLDELINDVTKYKHSSKYDGLVNNLALYLISAYDKTAKKEYLKGANNLFLWLEGSMDDTIINLNKLQIIKRERKLTEHEMKYLLMLIEKSEENNFILCGIYILLDDIKKFETCFKKLTTVEQNYFESLPIYSLL